ncbi:MAG: hypothetical protein PVG07_16660 [Acidobacteriota bacterium]|jgi:hypothetical protein
MTAHIPGGPRYPQLRVSLRTENPLALVSAIRLALRRAGTDRTEIERFTRDALASPDPRGLCRQWVRLEVRRADDPREPR